MKNPSNHSITKKIIKRVPMMISLMVLAAVIALNVLVKQPDPEPDRVYPMANANITWLQTHHNGAWSD